jgi:hypothetical protein
MNPHGPRLLKFESGGANWLARALLIASGAVLAAISLFFITIALVAGTVLVVAIGARWWWLTRRLRAAQHASAPLEGEYTVVERPELERLRR